MKKKPKLHRPSERPRVTARRKWLILVDEGPLRKKAIAQKDRLLAKIEEARRQWERFQKDDKSAFAQWMAATFGHLMTQLRETYGSIQEKQNLVAEVEDEMYWSSSRSYRAAYARVIHERANPPAAAPHREREPEASSYRPEEDYREAPRPGQPGARAESEEEMRFRSFVLFALGVSPEDLRPDEYEMLYQDFLTCEGEDRRSKPAKLRPAPGKKPAENRLKEIYRILVRRLHPDARKEAGAEALSIWHEVQEAYQQGNVERLEVLLALTETETEMAGEKSSLGQLQGLVAALETDLGAVRRSLKEARRDPAWDFVKRPNREALQRDMQREMEDELTYQQHCLRELEKQIQRWAAPQAKKSPPAPTPGTSYRSSVQNEFGF